MSQQEKSYNQSTCNQENAVNPMGLLFDEEYLRKAVEAEDWDESPSFVKS